MLSEYFVIPEAIFSLGLVFYIILSLKKESFDRIEADIQFDSITKKDIKKMNMTEKKY